MSEPLSSTELKESAVAAASAAADCFIHNDGIRGAILSMSASVLHSAASLVAAIDRLTEAMKGKR